jgi:hypothetical protein
MFLAVRTSSTEISTKQRCYFAYLICIASLDNENFINIGFLIGPVRTTGYWENVAGFIIGTLKLDVFVISFGIRLTLSREEDRIAT